MTGSRKWPVTAWRKLLERALPAIDEVGPGVKWTLGGGTALALKIHHRISYDIDIFFEDAGHLRALSPNRNRASHAITEKWQEPGHYIKFSCDEGEIDFIVATVLTDLTPWLYKFKGREIPIEEPAEILAKKLKYRGSRIIARDIFDILAAHRADPQIIKTAVSAAPEGARHAVDRIHRMADRFRTTIADEVNPTDSGADLLEIDPVRAAEILSG